VVVVTAVEPGYFRTDFLDQSSLSTVPTVIDDYHQSSGAMRTFAPGVNHQQPGDPAKLAKVLVKFADTPNPPVRLPLGSDTVAAIEKKAEETAQIIAAWRSTAVSTDFAQ
jgi:hypothetical protein